VGLDGSGLAVGFVNWPVPLAVLVVTPFTGMPPCSGRRGGVDTLV
jgi:hypothetical protein